MCSLCINKLDHSSKTCHHIISPYRCCTVLKKQYLAWTSGPLHNAWAPYSINLYCMVAVSGRNASLCIVDLCPILYIIPWHLIELFCKYHYDRWDRLHMQASYQVTTSGQKWIMWYKEALKYLKLQQSTNLPYIRCSHPQHVHNITECFVADISKHAICFSCQSSVTFTHQPKSSGIHIDALEI